MPKITKQHKICPGSMYQRRRNPEETLGLLGMSGGGVLLWEWGLGVGWRQPSDRGLWKYDFA